MASAFAVMMCNHPSGNHILICTMECWQPLKWNHGKDPIYVLSSELDGMYTLCISVNVQYEYYVLYVVYTVCMYNTHCVIYCKVQT